MAMPRAQQSRRARRDDCIPRTMSKPDRTKLPAVAALLLSSDLRLLVRHECNRRTRSACTSAEATMDRSARSARRRTIVVAQERVRASRAASCSMRLSRDGRLAAPRASPSHSQLHGCALREPSRGPHPAIRRGDGRVARGEHSGFQLRLQRGYSRFGDAHPGRHQIGSR